MVEKRSRIRSRHLEDSPAVFYWSLCSGLQKPWCMLILAAGAVLWRYDGQSFVSGMVFSALLVLIALLDCRYLLIYDRLLLVLLAFGFIPIVWSDRTLADALWGSFLGGGLLGLVHVLSPHGMGWGDVKLAAVLGWWLGNGICICLYIAFILGGLYGVFLLLIKRFQKDMVVPFGPFLAGGGILALAFADFWGRWLEAWLWM